MKFKKSWWKIMLVVLVLVIPAWECPEKDSGAIKIDRSGQSTPASRPNRGN